jgi:hypothetical protein
VPSEGSLICQADGLVITSQEESAQAPPFLHAPYPEARDTLRNLGRKSE